MPNINNQTYFLACWQAIESENLRLNFEAWLQLLHALLADAEQETLLAALNAEEMPSQFSQNLLQQLFHKLITELSNSWLEDKFDTSKLQPQSIMLLQTMWHMAKADESYENMKEILKKSDLETCDSQSTLFIECIKEKFLNLNPNIDMQKFAPAMADLIKTVESSTVTESSHSLEVFESDHAAIQKAKALKEIIVHLQGRINNQPEDSAKKPLLDLQVDYSAFHKDSMRYYKQAANKLQTYQQCLTDLLEQDKITMEQVNAILAKLHAMAFIITTREKHKVMDQPKRKPMAITAKHERYAKKLLEQYYIKAENASSHSLAKLAQARQQHRQQMQQCHQIHKQQQAQIVKQDSKIAVGKQAQEDMLALIVEQQEQLSALDQTYQTELQAHQRSKRSLIHLDLKLREKSKQLAQSTRVTETLEQELSKTRVLLRDERERFTRDIESLSQSLEKAQQGLVTAELEYKETVSALALGFEINLTNKIEEVEKHWQAQVAALQQLEIKKREALMAEHQSTQQVAKRDNARAHQKIAELTQDKEAIEAELTQTLQHVASLKRIVQTYGTELGPLKTRNQEMEQLLTLKTEEEKIFSAEFDKQRINLNRMSIQLAALEESITEKDQALEASVAELKLTKALLTQNQEKLAKTLLQLKESQEKCNAALIDAEDSDDKREIALSWVHDSQDRILSLQDTQAALITENQILEERLSASNKQCQELTHQIQQQHAELEALRLETSSTLSKQQSLTDRAHEEIQKQKALNDEAVTLAQQYEQRLTTLEEELTATKQELSAKSQKLDETTAKLAGYKRAVATDQEYIADQEQNLQRLQMRLQSHTAKPSVAGKPKTSEAQKGTSNTRQKNTRFFGKPLDPNSKAHRKPSKQQGSRIFGKNPQDHGNQNRQSHPPVLVITGF